MSNHLFMGAINKSSNDRESPKFADKKNNYMCPSCQKDVIFKKGQIKIPHFAHKASEIKCTFYDKPSETEIHKEAKILMKSLLNNKKELHFVLDEIIFKDKKDVKKIEDSLIFRNIFFTKTRLKTNNFEKKIINSYKTSFV